MTNDQKTRARLEVSVPEKDFWTTEEITEFTYTSNVLGVGDTCAFTVLSEPDGSTLRHLQEGATVKAYLRNPAVNGGAWTLKHSGILVTRDVDLQAGTIHVAVADLGWHLMNSSAPLWKRLRSLTLRDLLDPAAPAERRFLDPTFNFQGLRTGLDANALNRQIKLGKAGLLPPGNAAYDVVPIMQIEPGESYFDVLSRFCLRENVLVGVSVDGYLQAWTPDYARDPAYAFVASRAAGDANNCVNLKRHDDITTRYTAVVCVGEIVVNPADLRASGQDAISPNANKRRGYYESPSGMLPFNHRKTLSDGEMFSGDMARRQAEWVYKRGMFDSHHLEIDVLDHHQDGQWLEADQMSQVNAPEADAVGPYYVVSVTCSSTASDGDTTKLKVHWPDLLSASFGKWKNPPRYSGQTKKETTPGKGGGQ